MLMSHASVTSSISWLKSILECIQVAEPKRRVWWMIVQMNLPIVSFLAPIPCNNWENVPQVYLACCSLRKIAMLPESVLERAWPENMNMSLYLASIQKWVEFSAMQVEQWKSRTCWRCMEACWQEAVWWCKLVRRIHVSFSYDIGIIFLGFPPPSSQTGKFSSCHCTYCNLTVGDNFTAVGYGKGVQFLTLSNCCGRNQLFIK